MMEPISLRCPACATSFTDAPAGDAKSGKCPKCQAEVLFPSPRVRGVKWFYHYDGDEVGPVSFAQLQKCAAKGLITPDSQVRAEGMTEAVVARRIPQLFAAVRPIAKVTTPAVIDEEPTSPPSPVKARKAEKTAAPRSRKWMAIRLSVGLVVMTVLGGMLYQQYQNEPLPPVAPAPASLPDVVVGLTPERNVTIPIKSPTINNKNPAELPMPPAKPLVAGKGQPVVVLTQPSLPGDDLEDFQAGTLARELMRQAFLIAARDELGLATRDAVLREPTSGAPEQTFAADVKFARAAAPQFIVTREGDKIGQQAIGAAPGAEGYDYLRICEEAERLSREKFPEWLRQAGYESQLTATQKTDDVIAKIRNRLIEWSIPSYVAILRYVHAYIQDCGETPERLSVLVQTYANLGLMTESMLSPAHKVFKARAMLYAQRMVAKNPTDAFAYWHRAYALALAGLPIASIADIDRATELKSTQPQPEWAYVLVDEFKNAGGPTNVNPLASRLQIIQLFALLRMGDPRCPAQCYRVAKPIQDSLFGSVYAGDRMCQIDSIGPLRYVTDMFERHFANITKISLEELPEVPKECQPIIDEYQQNILLLPPALIRAAAPKLDRREPSWGVLAGLLIDMQTLQAHRRLHLAKDIWGQSQESVAQNTQIFRKRVEGSPYANFIQSYAFDAGRTPREFKSLIDAIDVRDIDFHGIDVIRQILRVDRVRGGLLLNRASAQCDFIRGDLEVRAQAIQTPQALAQVGEWLVKLDPRNAIGQSLLIEHRWNSPLVKSHLEEWKRTAPMHAAVARALATSYRKANQKDEATRYLKLSLEQSKDASVYHELADWYLKDDKVDECLKTLEDSLTSVDMGLMHANARVRLARHYMAKAEWEKAIPYAEAAAKTRAAWAMQVASECYEGAGKFEESELWIRRISEQYESSRADWFLWCARTGKGNLAESKKAFFGSFQGRLDRLTSSEALQLGLAHALLRETDKALDLLDESFQSAASPITMFMMMLIADEAGASAKRDGYLQALVTAPEGLGNLAKRFAKAIKDKKPVSPEECEKLLEALPEEIQSECSYIVGKFLLLRGNLETSQSFLRRCADDSEAGPIFRTMAKIALRGLV